jgi:hypothetical protein
MDSNQIYVKCLRSFSLVSQIINLVGWSIYTYTFGVFMQSYIAEYIVDLVHIRRSLIASLGSRVRQRTETFPQEISEESRAVAIRSKMPRYIYTRVLRLIPSFWFIR